MYRAKDTKLGREVAIKVLPDAFSQDPHRLERFEREAKVLASLNHPGVATLYGLESADGIQFLAMELVGGETLAERIDRGPIPLEEALPFGLAKALAGEDAAAASDLSQSPTLSHHATVGRSDIGDRSLHVAEADQRKTRRPPSSHPHRQLDRGARQMSLDAGTKLAQYEVVELIGKGGMGEVYRARDTKLDRDVAIKILPEEFAQDKDRLARFEREAKLLAQLNDAHIATLHGLEDEGGQRFLVMELVEGETLAERIARGPIPVDEALPLCLQIAEGLGAAHEKGILHRDLKPANIKVSADGKVKILDFGLAKAFAEGHLEGGASNELSQSPTLSRQATAAGLILGTAAYMSPEQAKGKTLDRRTDLWAFGVVVFEMLTAKRPFEGEDVSDTLAAVLRAEPQWDALPAGTPEPIRRLLRRCLEKDRRRRLDSAGAVRLDIEDAQAMPEEETSSPSRRQWPLALAGSLLFALGGLLFWSLASSESPGPRPVTRFSIRLPPGSSISPRGRHALAMSPDGTHVVYTADDQLYLRAMDREEPSPIRGTDGARGPFFSPDGLWVGFWADGQLKKVTIDGGAPVALCQVGNPRGASWEAEDTIVFAQSGGGILRVSANGGTPEVLVPLEDSHDLLSFGPQLLPGGKAVLFSLLPSRAQTAQIVVQSLETGERRVLIQEGTYGRYVPTGTWSMAWSRHFLRCRSMWTGSRSRAARCLSSRISGSHRHP